MREDTLTVAVSLQEVQQQHRQERTEKHAIQAELMEVQHSLRHCSVASRVAHKLFGRMLNEEAKASQQEVNIAKFEKEQVSSMATADKAERDVELHSLRERVEDLQSISAGQGERKHDLSEGARKTMKMGLAQVSSMLSKRRLADSEQAWRTEMQQSAEQCQELTAENRGLKSRVSELESEVWQMRCELDAARLEQQQATEAVERATTREYEHDSALRVLQDQAEQMRFSRPRPVCVCKGWVTAEKAWRLRKNKKRVSKQNWRASDTSGSTTRR